MNIFDVEPELDANNMFPSPLMDSFAMEERVVTEYGVDDEDNEDQTGVDDDDDPNWRNALIDESDNATKMTFPLKEAVISMMLDENVYDDTYCSVPDVVDVVVDICRWKITNVLSDFATKRKLPLKVMEAAITDAVEYCALEKLPAETHAVCDVHTPIFPPKNQ